MYDYHADIIWNIDRILFGAIIFLGLFDILYAAVKRAIEDRETRKLAIIKRNLRDLARSNPERVKDVCPVIVGKVTRQQFFEISRDREFTLPKELERELKDCFTASGKIGEIERIAKSSGNKWHRIQAIISLGYTGSPAAVEILKESLADRDEDVAYFSMLALGRIGDYPSARILLGYLEKHRYGGNKIISLLGNFPPAVIDEAIQETESADPAARFWSIKLISLFESKNYLQRIEDLAKDVSDDVRAAACECLGKMGAKEAEETLLHCLGDKVWFVRMHAVRALSAILGKESIPEIVGLLKDKTWLVRDTVKKAMVRNIDAALPYLERLVHESGITLKKDCVEVFEDSGYITILFRNLLSEDMHLKNKAAHLLRGVVNSGAHLGMEGALSEFGEREREDILRIIASIDKSLAEHIDKKIRHLLVET